MALNSMFNIRKRLGASILLTLLSLISICLLLPSKVSTKLQKITLGTSIDDYAGLWRWGDETEDDENDDSGDGLRLIVFGDSWVDEKVEKGQEGKGKSWPQVLCEEMSCKSRLNFASSQAPEAWPDHPPTGVMASNEIHRWAVSNTRFLSLEESNKSFSLPDLATQVQSFISLPAPKEQPKETIFVISFGFWDIYDFARLDYAMSMNVTDRSVNFLFEQLDILYEYFTNNLVPSPEIPTSESANITQKASKSPLFRVIIPRLFDPTLLPGWLSHRPVPLAPSSVAEEHKNAIYLTERWNQLLENQMGSWINSVSQPEPETSDVDEKQDQEPEPEPEQPRADVRENDDENREFEQFSSRDTPEEPTGSDSSETPEAKKVPVIQKDIFYYDIPKLLLDLLIEHQLEDEGLSDASGLGTGESPFESVYTPCVHPAGAEDTDGMVDLNGMLVCKEPESYLWWDAWTLGAVAKETIAKEIAGLVKEGRSLRKAWENLSHGS